MTALKLKIILSVVSFVIKNYLNNSNNCIWGLYHAQLECKILLLNSCVKLITNTAKILFTEKFYMTLFLTFRSFFHNLI